jgi:hypothetical protein
MRDLSVFCGKKPEQVISGRAPFPPKNILMTEEKNDEVHP